MNPVDLSLQTIRDPKLAAHALSSAPALIWSSDGARILWANAAGLKFLGVPDQRALADKAIGPADPHRRQVTQLAGRLSPTGALRLERLRGFGAAPGNLMTCACARLAFGNGVGILVAAAQPAGRVLPLEERLTALIEGLDNPALAFTRDGRLVGGNRAAGSLPDFAADAPEMRLPPQGASRDPVTVSTSFGPITLYRVGLDAESGIVGLIAPSGIENTIAETASPPPVQPGERTCEGALETTSAAVEASPSALDSFVAPESPMDTPADTSEAEWNDNDPNHVLSDAIEAHPTETDVSPSPTTTPPPSEHRPSGGQTTASAPFDDESWSPRRRHPLRFMWQMDADGRFSLGSDEFTRLIGWRTAAAFGRLWNELAEALDLDPEGRVAAAIATRATWSGIAVNWPVDGLGARLPVELSGLPVYDRDRQFAGYRGFGICRDLEGLTRLAAQRRHDALFGNPPSTASPQVPSSPAQTTASQHATFAPDPAPGSEPPAVIETPPSPTETDHTVDTSAEDTPANVVLFPSAQDTRAPSLTATENSAFHEIARQLSARLEADSNRASDIPQQDAKTDDAVAADASAPTSPAGHSPSSPMVEQPDLPLHAYATQDGQLLDHIPVGMLIYQIDRLIHANRAFLEHTGFASLAALDEAGGLDALYVEPGNSDETTQGGTPVLISTSGTAAAPARLHAVTWDGESAHALIFAPAQNVHPQRDLAPTAAAASADQIGADEMAAILETTAEGILIFDAAGHISSCNRSAEALFNVRSGDVKGRPLTELFAPESQRAILDYIDGIKASGVASLLDQGREVLGRTPSGSTVPLSMTVGRTGAETGRYFAIFRDTSPVRTGEPQSARRSNDQLANAKAEMLTRLSHEIRAPVNAIIGFSEVMIDERFGPLGNERYVDYMKDIRASGERVIAIIEDMLNLSRIESGKLDLALVDQDINPLIEQCVAVMQPQANRERIIIRTSLAHALPTVRADTRALRQIALNLIGNSIHLANAGGQVIVSTALTDRGDVVLRVRDTGHGLNESEIAAAMAPFHTPAASDHLLSNNSVSLPLTKALVEANGGQFHIKSAPQIGTLIEVVFAHTTAQAI
ncbi:MAG: PAS domain-containing protein [Afipia sp.]|nr:PAS domain-containing protein [Afipia sp.]